MDFRGRQVSGINSKIKDTTVCIQKLTRFKSRLCQNNQTSYPDVAEPVYPLLHCSPDSATAPGQTWITQKQLWPHQQVSGKAGILAERPFCLQCDQPLLLPCTATAPAYAAPSQQGEPVGLYSSASYYHCKQLLENTAAQCKPSCQSSLVFPLKAPL